MAEIQNLIDSIPAGICLFSKNNAKITCIAANRTFIDMIGAEEDTLTGKSFDYFIEKIHPEDRERCRQDTTALLRKKRNICGRYREYNKKKDIYIWIQLDGKLVPEPDGSYTAYFVYTDVSDVMLTEQALGENQLALESMIKHIPGGVFVYYEDNDRFTFVSDNMLNMLGYTKEEFHAKFGGKFSNMIYPEDRERVLLEIESQIAVGLFDTCTYRIEKKDGTILWVHDEGHIVSSIGGRRSFYVVIVDITSSVIARNDLENQNSELRTMLVRQEERESDFNRIIQELMATDPNSLCTFRLNLSQNSCSDEHGISEYIEQLLNAHTADELLEKIASIITDKKEADNFRKKINRKKLMEYYLKGENKVSATYRRLSGDGDINWVTTNFNILQNPYTNDIEVIAHSIDSDTERKKEQILSVLTEEEYDYIGLIDIGKERIKYYYISESDFLTGRNKAAGYDETIRSISEINISEQERDEFCRDLNLQMIEDQLKEAGVYQHAFFCINEVGVTYRKQLSYRYLESDRKEIMVTCADITAAFLHEETYTQQLQKALEEAEKANRMKTDFLGSVSHDMRTPLNAILGYDRLALITDKTSEKKDYLEKINIAGNTLMSLINDTLDLQKIENGAIELRYEAVSCGVLIKEILTSIQPMMQKKNITFELDNSRAVMADIRVDSMRLRQIFINLLSNAAKFTPEGGRVDFIVECTGLEKNCVHDRIIIRDSGIGMSREFQEKMFEPFSQERTKKTIDIGGSGLGLSIVKRLIDRMGGRIEVKSEQGKGTEITVYMDFETTDNNDTVKADDGLREMDISGLRALVCEDNPMNMEITVKILEMFGIEAVRAVDGKEGLEIFEQSDPEEYDIILMDIRMPIMDGYTAAKKIRASAHAAAKNIPILAMSADAYESDIERAISAGMNGHIAKPVDPKKIRHEIYRLTSINENKTGKNNFI